MGICVGNREAWDYFPGPPEHRGRQNANEAARVSPGRWYRDAHAIKRALTSGHIGGNTGSNFHGLQTDISSGVTSPRPTSLAPRDCAPIPSCLLVFTRARDGATTDEPEVCAPSSYSLDPQPPRPMSLVPRADVPGHLPASLPENSPPSFHSFVFARACTK